MSSAEADQDGRELALQAEAEGVVFVQPGEETTLGDLTAAWQYL